MLILTASNITGESLSRPNGTADYDVWVGINSVCIWRGKIENHKRAAGAATLLRLIADQMDAMQTLDKSMPFLSRLFLDEAVAQLSQIQRPVDTRQYQTANESSLEKKGQTWRRV